MVQPQRPPRPPAPASSPSARRVRQYAHDCSLCRADDPGRAAPTRPRTRPGPEGDLHGLHDGRRRPRDERGSHLRGARRGHPRFFRRRGHPRSFRRRGRGQLPGPLPLWGGADAADGPRRGPGVCFPGRGLGVRGRASPGCDGPHPSRSPVRAWRARRGPGLVPARAGRLLDHRAPERAHGRLHERAAGRRPGARRGGAARARRRRPHRRAQPGAGAGGADAGRARGGRRGSLRSP